MQRGRTHSRSPTAASGSLVYHTSRIPIGTTATCSLSRTTSLWFEGSALSRIGNIFGMGQMSDLAAHGVSLHGTSKEQQCAGVTSINRNFSSPRGALCGESDWVPASTQSVSKVRLLRQLASAICDRPLMRSAQRHCPGTWNPRNPRPPRATPTRSRTFHARKGFRLPGSICTQSCSALPFARALAQRPVPRTPLTRVVDEAVTLDGGRPE